mmetsp:Transcript_15414/g.43107  ORF Transcript_15414/g.43107 Transcript_15414/m.43107 type:complete len:273 (+) Transcript_15414:1716-2534(+)
MRPLHIGPPGFHALSHGQVGGTAEQVGHHLVVNFHKANFHGGGAAGGGLLGHLLEQVLENPGGQPGLDGEGHRGARCCLGAAARGGLGGRQRRAVAYNVGRGPGRPGRVRVAAVAEHGVRLPAACLAVRQDGGVVSRQAVVRHGLPYPPEHRFLGDAGRDNLVEGEAPAAACRTAPCCPTQRQVLGPSDVHGAAGALLKCCLCGREGPDADYHGDIAAAGGLFLLRGVPSGSRSGDVGRAAESHCFRLSDPPRGAGATQIAEGRGQGDTRAR